MTKQTSRPCSRCRTGTPFPEAALANAVLCPECFEAAVLERCPDVRIEVVDGEKVFVGLRLRNQATSAEKN